MLPPFSSTWDEHIKNLWVILSRLRKAGLTLDLVKRHLDCTKVMYIGHVVECGRRRPSDIKVVTVVNYC